MLAGRRRRVPTRRSWMPIVERYRAVPDGRGEARHTCRIQLVGRSWWSGWERWGFDGFVGRYPFPGAGAAPVAVAEVGFLVVMPAAEARGVLETGVPGGGPRVAVVDLQAPAHLAVGHD